MPIPVDSHKILCTLIMFACFFCVLSIFLAHEFSESKKNSGQIFVNAPCSQMAITSLICFGCQLKKIEADTQIQLIFKNRYIPRTIYIARDQGCKVQALTPILVQMTLSVATVVGRFSYLGFLYLGFSSPNRVVYFIQVFVNEIQPVKAFNKVE